jgi:hypothetical protein
MDQPEFKTIKQPKGSMVCGAAVTAMAVGCTLQQAYDGMWRTMNKGKPYFRTSEVLKFLGAHGIYSGPIAFNDDGGLDEIDASTDIIFTCPMSRAAIITVKSRTHSDWTHYVFWDGKHVRDPHPDEPDTTDLKDYDILDIMFLTYLTEIEP